MLTQASGDLSMLIAAARAQHRNVLSEPEAKAFLRAQGIPVPPGRVVPTPEEASGVVREIGAPVVVKAVAHQLTHKTEAGAVMFPIDSAAAAGSPPIGRISCLKASWSKPIGRRSRNGSWRCATILPLVP